MKQVQFSSIALLLVLNTSQDGGGLADASRLPFVAKGKNQYLSSRSQMVSNDIRGGSQEKELSSTLGWCSHYTKIGFLNLSEKGSKNLLNGGNDNTLTKGNSVATFIVDSWVKSQINAKYDGDATSAGSANIVAIPSLPSGESDVIDTSEYVFKQTFLNCEDQIDEVSFALGSKQHKNIGNIAETIGAVSDSVIIFYDVNNDSRHVAIKRLMNGIGRQIGQGKKVEVLIFANEGEALNELNDIQSLLSYDGVRIIPATKFDQDVYEHLHETEAMNAVQNSQVPMDILPRYIGRVHNKISGKSMDLTFESIILKLVKAQSRNRGIRIPFSILALGVSVLLTKIIFAQKDEEEIPDVYLFDYDSIMDSLEDTEELGFDYNSLMEKS